MAVGRSSSYQEYFRALDDLGGIFYHRWGDAPIHLLGVALFLLEKQTHRFTDIAYAHKVYVMLPDTLPD